MPSTHQKGKDPSYPEMPEAEAKFGENPARFTASNRLMVKARIRAIEDPDHLAAYLRAEGNRAGGPRSNIINAIHARIDEVADS